MVWRGRLWCLKVAPNSQRECLLTLYSVEYPMDPGGCKVLEGEGVNTGSVVNSKITSSLTHIHQLTLV